MQRYEDITTERARPIAATIILVTHLQETIFVTPSPGDYLYLLKRPLVLSVPSDPFETICFVDAILLTRHIFSECYS